MRKSYRVVSPWCRVPAVSSFWSPAETIQRLAVVTFPLKSASIWLACARLCWKTPQWNTLGRICTRCWMAGFCSFPLLAQRSVKQTQDLWTGFFINNPLGSSALPSVSSAFQSNVKQEIEHVFGIVFTNIIRQNKSNCNQTKIQGCNSQNEKKERKL